MRKWRFISIWLVISLVSPLQIETFWVTVSIKWGHMLLMSRLCIMPQYPILQLHFISFFPVISSFLQQLYNIKFPPTSNLRSWVSSSNLGCLTFNLYTTTSNFTTIFVTSFWCWWNLQVFMLLCEINNFLWELLVESIVDLIKGFWISYDNYPCTLIFFLEVTVIHLLD